MAGENVQDYSSVINSIASAKGPKKQMEIIVRFLSSNELRVVAELFYDINQKAAQSMPHAKALLLLLDYPTFYKTIGKKDYDNFLFLMKGSSKLQSTEELFETAKSIKSTAVNLFKAKSAMMLQLLFLLRERIQEQGLPVLSINGTEVVKKVARSGESKSEMIVDLEEFGKGYWNLFVEILKEADFRSDDKIKYRLMLSENMITQYSTGANLVGSGMGEGGQTALSDAMVTRLGRNIVKRLSLLLRTIKMYQSADHPSINLGLESLHSTISEVLEHRPSITLTRMGSDLLIDDIKNRKSEQFVDDFVDQMDVRNLNSLTITQGVSLEEVRAFSMLFALSHAQIKKKGGAKKILDSQGVTHVLMDQYKYGIISGDTVTEADNVAMDEKMIENLVFTELVSRLKEGKSLGDLKAEEVGAAFKQLLSGAFRKDEKSKQTLAQMILAIDPSLAERAVFENEGIRDDLNWSTARHMIDELLVELPKGNPEVRIKNLDNLERMSDLAITRNKDTSLITIIEKIVDRLKMREKDLEVVSKIIDVLSDTAKQLVINGKYSLALTTLRNVFQIRQRFELMPEEKMDDFTRAMPGILSKIFENVGEAEVVEVLVREFEGDSLETVDKVTRILEMLNSEESINKLLDGFSSPSRSVRNRCFQALLTIGEKTLNVALLKLKAIDDPQVFLRKSDNTLDDDAYFIARNCVDLIAKMGQDEQTEIFMSIKDDSDPRLRKQIMLSLAKLKPAKGAEIAFLNLDDPDQDVVKFAIITLGSLKSEESMRKLVDLFYAQPDLRTTILQALAMIGGADAEKLMSGATFLRFGGNLGRIYRFNPELRMVALKGLGQCGNKAGLHGLRKFALWMNIPIVRLLFVPLKSLRLSKEFVKISRDALSRVEYRLKTGAA